MILKPYPMSERPALRIKITAAEVMKGGRQTWGFRRKWEGNYLTSVRISDKITSSTPTHTSNIYCQMFYVVMVRVLLWFVSIKDH